MCQSLSSLLHIVTLKPSVGLSEPSIEASSVLISLCLRPVLVYIVARTPLQTCPMNSFLCPPRYELRDKRIYFLANYVLSSLQIHNYGLSTLLPQQGPLLPRAFASPTRVYILSYPNSSLRTPLLPPLPTTFSSVHFDLTVQPRLT